MFVSIDWVSFTFEMEEAQSVLGFELWGRAAEELSRQFPLAKQMLIDGWDFTPKIGRAPYNAAQRRSDNGVTVFAHQRIDHSLVEVGGIGCDTLGSIEAEIALIQEVAPRMTRLDVAVDIYTEVLPDEFAPARSDGRFKSRSEAISPSGHTVYVGSKSSDRYARVYRYFDPHPRARFLRVEHVLKSEQAREAVKTITEVGLDAFVAMLGNTFDWSHPAWKPEVNTDEAVKAWTPERRAGRTVLWLHEAVAPALKKLVDRKSVV